VTLARARVKLGRRFSWIDVVLFVGVFLFIYALIGVANEWASPYRPKTEISLDFLSLVRYSIFSLVRVLIAYVLSLCLTFTYGYLAAKSKVGEMILIPLLDILQSVPVLGFMPGLVLALVNLFPMSNLGLELAAIIMIFTGQGWNMVFSFYSSVKNVPTDLREVGSLFRLGKWEVFKTIELPYSMNGLLWNSMLSMAGGWFFVMTIESFSLGEKDFRLPGIGSYMAVAYERGNLTAIVWGIAAMFTLIILVDRVIWAPLVVWSERFKFDRDSHGPLPTSIILEWLKRSNLLAAVFKRRDELVKWYQQEKISRADMLDEVMHWGSHSRRHLPWIRVILAIILLLGTAYGARSIYLLLAGNSLANWLMLVKYTFFTFLRVSAAVVLGSLWTIPVGVFIGTHPKWTSRLQPVVQVVASFPAPMLFPIIVYLLLRLNIGLEIGAIALMLFASQWYILFNVISGATRIPHQMLDVAQVFRVKGLHRWKAILLPAIFPSLVNGWITAAGGAWNACIVSEFVLYQNQELTATGIGAAITKAAQQGNFPELAAAIFVMVMTVVLINRFFWGNLYRLAETRFRLEG